MRNRFIKHIIFCSITGIIYYGCSKGGDPTPTPTPTPTPIPTIKTCIISGVSQLNSGSKAEFALSVTYNSSLNPTRFYVFDSSSNTKIFDASLQYVTTDSIRVDQYQYFKLDAGKRVSQFITLSDITDPANADRYRYEYIYDANGYLVTKNLYVNGSATASYNTVYTYTSNLLTKCVMTVAGNASLKVLEATLTYDNNTTATNWMYCFPDGFESIYFTSALNFGTKPSKALSQVITKLYNPVTAAVLDTWTTNYANYSVNSAGYIASGVATGDLQQGMPGFYGKTSFYYQCQ